MVQQINAKDDEIIIPMKSLVNWYLDGLMDVQSVTDKIKKLANGLDKVILTFVGSAGFDGSSG